MQNQEAQEAQNISLIVAVDQHNAIGKDNQLLWHLPNDLKFFKKTTSGHSIIMGRKTYDSIGKPLPNRRNIIITRQKDLQIDGAELYSSLAEALIQTKNENEVFIIGGAEIYKQSLGLAHKIYLTLVHHVFEADTYLTDLKLEDWNILSREDFSKDEKHAYDYSFLILQKP
ncbi:dihydrofolate reductase [Pedobacter aquae]|jgi:dihydrofolate reductase|uniref:Dihydrofolate reductase n=1 Tax=Pedobacter aquae TaxID=2605747 RepID=A0A5C0VE91_9SPHI|nr:dihydrofolate reductase [Pedobacter aquae]QEK50766.1 dihydrofolate reductase [Pedobacter aquae]